MKVILAIAVLAVMGCNEAAKTETMSMPGAYSMLSQSVNDGKTDTTYTNLKQLKIFTGDHMMYANVNPADSVSSFGVGTYTADSGNIMETVMYSASDTSVNAMGGTFKLVIAKTAKGYQQVIPEITGSSGQKFKLTEEYESVGTTAKTALDGVWKQVKGYNIKGKDTSANTAVQYKAYSAGNFLFGHTYTDSTKKSHTGMGFGTFEMSSPTKVKENVQASTYYQIRGKSFDIEIVLNGTDGFTQTITGTDGSKSVEIYERLKK
jgi:hypothetical protein